MDLNLLDILRCPFCGSRFDLARSSFLEAEGGRALTGTLSCRCCAYPIVAGIPYLRDDDAAQRALEHLDGGDKEKALFALLGLKGAPLRQFQRLLKRGPALTFQSALPVLCREGERSYFLHRFSHPTYLCGEALLRALAQDRHCFSGRVLDVGGGPGHLTRVLCRLARGPAVLQVNYSFAELWLAGRFLAPSCQPVCCDANKPLPFVREAFSFVFCSDAFHYIWSKRLLACEMMRLLGEGGAVLLAHLHNALVENEAAGMPLAPADYLNLFDALGARLYKETAVLGGLRDRAPVDLSARWGEKDLGGEQALVLLATRRTELFRAYQLPAVSGDRGASWAINPLYQLERQGGKAWLRLGPLPSGVADDFAYHQFQLPETVAWTDEMEAGLRAGRLDGPLRELARCHVLLDLPENYAGAERGPGLAERKRKRGQVSDCQRR
jgi:SAM-dependent methyltransferase/uncharacterized protein YbaR (Trm112 family)